jgi:hypothetical protein
MWKLKIAEGGPGLVTGNNFNTGNSTLTPALPKNALKLRMPATSSRKIGFG